MGPNCTGTGGAYRLDQPDDIAFLYSFGIDPASWSRSLGGASPANEASLRPETRTKPHSPFETQTGSGSVSHSVSNRDAPWIAVRRSSPEPVFVNPCGTSGGPTTM